MKKIHPQQSANKPPLLKGIKVLNFSRILTSPWAGLALADFGATVWNIERSGVG